uniref:Uncharacterized protein n=1 Tax=Romanomermis culicivorax TaxID=13658 RepID=A0A915JDK6_ROMCU
MLFLQVYGEEFPLEGQLDRRKTLLENLLEKNRERSMDRRKASNLPINRRESAMVRTGAPFDKGSTAHLRSLLTEKLENEELKVSRISAF